jgi:hypothetical protein
MDEIPQYMIAEYAVKVYSYLLTGIGTYTPKQFTDKIRSAYEIDSRRQEEIDAIENCVIKIIKDWNGYRTTIRRG